MDILKKDHICVDNNITSIKQKGSTTITIKCATPTIASNVDSILTSKYKDIIKVSKVNSTKAQIKIVRVVTDAPQNEFKQLLIEHNN